MSFQDDVTWFEKNRLFIAQQYAGQYVIVKDLTIRGAYPTYGDAMNAAMAMFGPGPIVIKRATEVETGAIE